MSSQKKVMSKPKDKCRIDYCTEKLDYFTIQQELRNLEGKVLTILDGAVSGDRQNKAIKDLFRKDIYKTMSKFAVLTTPKEERGQFVLEDLQ